MTDEQFRLIMEQLQGIRFVLVTIALLLGVPLLLTIVIYATI